MENAISMYMIQLNPENDFELISYLIEIDIIFIPMI